VTVLTLLKKHGVKHDFSLADDLPAIDEEPAIPYESGELKKLFEAMDPEEPIRYKFFLARRVETKKSRWLHGATSILQRVSIMSDRRKMRASPSKTMKRGQ
jgi:hypothetical protein